jgi:hypothetical protein
MLALLAKYFRYTGDQTVLLRHRGKLEAIQNLLSELHDEGLKLPGDDPGHGLIHGRSEADSWGLANPTRYWQPYFSNSALAVRGFRDLGSVWSEIGRTVGQPALEKMAEKLAGRSRQLHKTLIASIERSIRREMNPPYVGALPGMEHTFDEDARLDPWGPQWFSGRPYMELLQADVLPPNLANLVIDCLRAYRGTTLGIPGGRKLEADERYMYGFLSYGYAQMLLRLQRAEEFLLFLYAHRYHLHQRGHWTAREAAGISRRSSDTYFFDPYCTPVQQAVPLLIRWMLVLEDSDEERLYLGRGIPRSWVASGKEISIKRAPTRWGEVSFSLAAKPDKKTLHAIVELTKPAAFRELHVTLRVPEGTQLRTVRVNGHLAEVTGPKRNTVVVKSELTKYLEVNARYG